MSHFSDQAGESAASADAVAPAIGESTRLLDRAPDGVPLSLLYEQQGPILYRIGGAVSTAEGTPTPDVLAVADAIISGERTVAEDGAHAQER